MIRLLRTVFAFLLLSLFTAVPQLQAFWCEDGVPVCAATGYQRNLETVYVFTGHTLLTWDDGRLPVDKDIYVQRLDDIGSAQWPADGLAICQAAGDQVFPHIISDGKGGAIVAWEDERGTDSDIYAQGVSPGGSIQWTVDGVRVCSATGDQEAVRLVTDEAFGAIMVWIDFRNTDSEIYAQRIGATGMLQWSKDGIPVSTVAGTKLDMQVVSDGSGGAIIVWSESRGGASLADIYAQRIDGSGKFLWAAGGVPVCTAAGNQLEAQIVSDAEGGAIVLWTDNRSGINKAYVQRISSTGSPLWTADGVPLCTQAYANLESRLIFDGEGGAIVTWNESRQGATGYDVYAQRVSDSGAVLWDPEGVNVSPVAEGQGLPEIAADGSGGAIITWIDEREGQSRVYAQKIDRAGALQWRTGGAPVCLTVAGKENLRISEDGTGGAVIAWRGLRNELSNEIYAQWVDANGMPGYRPTVISSVSDLPGDEGGWVRLTIEKHSYDDEGWFRYPIYMYNTYRRVDNPALLAAIEGQEFHSDQSPSKAFLDGWPMVELDGRMFLTANELLPVQYFPPGVWEVLGSFNAFRQDQYLTVAGTLSDSTSAGIPRSVFCVSAHTLDPSMWYVSAPDSGYSVDNIAPAVPTGLNREPDDILAWDESGAGDFLCFSVFGSEFAQRDGSETLIAHTTGTSMNIAGLAYPYYLVTATDRHGNESGPATLDGLSPVPQQKMPQRTALIGNMPNPFNPATVIHFDLAGPTRVRLKVFDVSGRVVRSVLAGATLPAGRHEARWDGRDENGQAAAAGVYLYRLEAGSFLETRRMTLLK